MNFLIFFPKIQNPYQKMEWTKWNEIVHLIKYNNMSETLASFTSFCYIRNTIFYWDELSNFQCKTSLSFLLGASKMVQCVANTGDLSVTTGTRMIEREKSLFWVASGHLTQALVWVHAQLHTKWITITKIIKCNHQNLEFFYGPIA